MTGSFDSLSLQNSGSGEVSAFGMEGDASVDISCSGDTYISGSPKTSTTGKASGSGDVSYTGGSCVLSSSSCGPICEKSQESVPTIPLPSLAGSILAGASKCA